MVFKAGVSGNVQGRPKGSGHRQQLFNTLVGPHQEALFDRAIKLALEGNESMLRLFLERILPAKSTDDTTPFSLPDGDSKIASTLLAYGESILQMVSQGEITTAQADSLMKLIEAQRKNIETSEMAERLKEIVRTLNQRQKEK